MEQIAYHKNRYLVDHWNGLHSIARVIWINLFAFSLIVSVLLDLLPQDLNSVQTAFGVFVLNAFLIWQLMGAFRTLLLAVKNPTDIVLTISLVVAIFIVLPMSVWRSLEMITPPQETQVTATASETKLLEVSNDGHTVFIKGDINYPLHMSLLATLEKNEQIKTVMLSSDGGIIFAARAMAIKITEQGLNTKVEENCYSACTLIFMAGSKRELGNAGELGFHLYATKSTLTASILDIEAQVEKDKDYLRARGVAEGFIKTAYSTPPDEIWVPNKDQLERSGILTPIKAD
ncbi:MAG: hypothetical protein ABJE63_15325 [Lentilitoribacter sp.]